MGNLDSIVKILELVAQIIKALGDMGLKVNGEVNVPQLIDLFTKP